MNIFVFLVLILIALLITYAAVQYAWLHQLLVSDKDLVRDFQAVNRERESRLLRVAQRSHQPEVRNLFDQIQSSIHQENELIADFLDGDK